MAVGGTWLRIPGGIALALPSLEWLLLSLGVALRPSAMGFTFTGGSLRTRGVHLCCAPTIYGGGLQK